ncbi:hypothetical protein GCM10029976_034850 [Kribbella albertanoniae]
MYIPHVELRPGDRATDRIGEAPDTPPYFTQIGDRSPAADLQQPRPAEQPAVFVPGRDAVHELLPGRVPSRLDLIVEPAEIGRGPGRQVDPDQPGQRRQPGGPEVEDRALGGRRLGGRGDQDNTGRGDRDHR